ncbi:MAG: hypothetical protein IJZ64_04935 [Ruminococcus sp.]|nr:hypothetical protein [Oscillospiraceae bacterium]MBQ8824560.1 hypothetical protein [Ruminococcus sp.]
MVNKKLLENKKQIQKAKNILKSMSSIKVLHIYDIDYIEQLEKINFKNSGYYSSLKIPDSKISYDTDEFIIYRWIIDCMKLKNKELVYFLCNNIWTKIQIIDVESAVKELWNYNNESKGFIIFNEKLHKLLEVGSDSRDENNYLYDEFIICQ